MSTLYQKPCVFTVDFHPVEGETKTTPGGEARDPRDQSFDVAIVEFGDKSGFADPEQLKAAAGWITKTRDGKFRDNGVITMVFIHGWHHGANWEDGHFSAFRRVLAALSI